MKSRFNFVAVVGGASIVLSGCLTASTIAPMRYYTIAASPKIETAPMAGKSLGIRPLLGAKPYKLAIAYTAEDHRLAYFSNAEWADLPAAVVNRALSDGLLALGLFSEVDDAANMTRPDLVLTGELRRFEADFNRDVPVAILEISYVLRDSSSTESLWQGFARAESPIELAAGVDRGADASLEAVADAMSRALSQVVEQACAQVAQVVQP